MKLERGNDEHIAYEHFEGASPGIVFLSGFNSNMQGDKAVALDAWCRQSGRQFTRFDYQGHGDSSGKFEDGSIGRWIDDALAVLDEVASGPLVLVGSSMGGWIMLQVALARPDRVIGLVGIAAAPEELFRLGTLLGEVGVTRISALGHMTAPEPGWHHDGRFNLLDLVTLTEIEQSAEGAANAFAPYTD